MDGAGDIFISDTNNKRVVEIPAGCTALPARPPWAAECPIRRVLGWMERAMSSLRILATAEWWRFRRVDGGAQTTVGYGLYQPYGGAVVDAAGDVFIPDTGNSRVVEIPAGCASSACQTTVGYRIIDPRGLAVDAANDVFIADPGLNRVFEVPSGCASSSCQTTVGSGFNTPFGVAVDGAGNVFIADTYNSRVVEVPAGCASSSCQTLVGSGLNNPEGLAVDGAGDVFIADTFNSRVVEVQTVAVNFGNVNVCPAGQTVQRPAARR